MRDVGRTKTSLTGFHWKEILKEHRQFCLLNVCSICLNASMSLFSLSDFKGVILQGHESLGQEENTKV